MAPHSGELLEVPPGAPAGASRPHGPTLAELRRAGSRFRWRSLFLGGGSGAGLDDEAGPCPCEWVKGGLKLGIGPVPACLGDVVHGWGPTWVASAGGSFR